MKLQTVAFQRVVDGLKTLELRLYDDKRAAIRLHDEIEFLELPTLERTVRVQVTGLLVYPTFAGIIDDLPTSFMKQGSIIVDVTAGYGSGFMPTFNRSTDFMAPVYQRFGVLHCKIDVLPLGYPATTVNAMSQHLAPYIIDLGDTVYDPTRQDPTAEAGKIVAAGAITHAEVRRHFERQ